MWTDSFAGTYTVSFGKRQRLIEQLRTGSHRPETANKVEIRPMREVV